MLDVVDGRIVLAERFRQRILELKHLSIVAADLLRASLRARLEQTRALQKDRDGVSDAVPEHPRTPVVGDVVDLGERDTRASETRFDRLEGKADVVFGAREALFFSRVNELAVPEQSGGGLTHRRQTEHVHFS